MLNEKQSLPCRHWCHGPMFFLRWFMCLVLLLLLHHSGKLSITHEHMFLLIQILNLVLSKSMQRQGELSISGDSLIFLWWLKMAIAAYHSWGELIHHLFGTDLLRSIFDRQFQNFVLLVLQKCGDDCVVIGGMSTPFGISGCAIDLVDGAQCKFKCKHWFVF